MVTTRRGTPTWTAARPMPGAAYMVSSIESMSLRRSSSTRSTGALFMRSLRSGRVMISSFVTGLRYGTGTARSTPAKSGDDDQATEAAEAAQDQPEPARPGARRRPKFAPRVVKQRGHLQAAAEAPEAARRAEA